MPASLGRWPSLADDLGQRELAYFKQIFFRDIKPLHGGRLLLGPPQRIPDTRRRSASPRSEPGHGLAVAQERPREVVWQVAAQHRPEGK